MEQQNIYPEIIENERQLDELLSRPSEKTTAMFSRLDGDILFLGVTGKIGPSLAVMAARACEKVGVRKRILGVSRQIDIEQQKKLDAAGIESVRGDLLDPEFLRRLPPMKNVFFLAGMKFGSAVNLPLTWAVNSYLPAMVADHFKSSRIVAFSTGCVYPLVPTGSGGSLETDLPEAHGEYAQSCLGRERMFEYGSIRHCNPSVIIRLNYSVEMRYGVLTDIAVNVMNRQPVDLTMGYFNIIWQGDMNNMVLRSVEHASSPALILNITGPETLSVREVATEFGRLMGVEPLFINKEAPTALLNDASRAFELFGKPEVTPGLIIKWLAHWLLHGGSILNKPTHFGVRNGIY